MENLRKHKMAPWPRRLENFPIIIIAILQEYIWAIAILWDKGTINVTAVQILERIMPWGILLWVLLIVPSLAVAGFYMSKRRNTLLALIPQQFLLYLSAGGALEAIVHGHFADGVERSQAFLLADQCAAFLIAAAHTWAMSLILRYGEDKG
jgi:hypothetical protein